MSDGGRKALKGFLFAILLLGLAEATVRFWARRIEPYDLQANNSVFNKLNLYLRTPKPDLCFVGSSRTDQAFRAEFFKQLRVYGIPIRRLFNLGVGFGMVNKWMAVRMILRAEPLPRLVVIETSPCEFNRHYPNPLFEFLPFEDGVRFGLATRSPELLWACLVGWLEHSVLERFSLLFRFRQAIEYFLYDETSAWTAAMHFDPVRLVKTLKRFREVSTAPEDGYSMMMTPGEERLNELRRDPRFDPTYAYCQDFQWDRQRARLFEDSVDSLIAYGVKVILLELPASGIMEQYNYTPRMLREYSSYISDLHRSRGIPYLPLGREQCGLNDEEFRDLVHLAPSGGRKVSLTLYRMLSRLEPGNG